MDEKKLEAIDLNIEEEEIQVEEAPKKKSYIMSTILLVVGFI